MIPEQPKDSAYSLIRKNSNIIYSDTVEDKEIIYIYLNERIESAIALSSAAIGTKNLIYFSVFGSDEYVAMLGQCLKSIAALSDQSKFDLMVITDTLTKAKIEALSVVSTFPTFDYFIVDTPDTGIDASIQKMRIFDYPNISQYKKILFMDCDMLVPSAIEPVFAEEIDSTLIQVASAGDAPLIAINNNPGHMVFHVLDYFSEDNKAYISANPDKCHAFNAGQFLFVNSQRMKKHFENVQWLIQVWPGEYYFEQSFMNHYFLLNGFASWQLLDVKTLFINISLEKRINSHIKKVLRAAGRVDYKIVNLIERVCMSDKSTHDKALTDTDEADWNAFMKKHGTVTIPNKTQDYSHTGISVHRPEISVHRAGITVRSHKFINYHQFKEAIKEISISDYYLLHFIGKSTNGEVKLTYINQFMIDKNICQ